MPAKTIRQMTIEERRRQRGLYNSFEAEVDKFFVTMMSFPDEDHRFLNALDNRADGAAWLDMLIGMFGNSNRQRVFTVVRQWSMSTGKRRLLDVVEKWERCLKHKKADTEIT